MVNRNAMTAFTLALMLASGGAFAQATPMGLWKVIDGNSVTGPLDVDRNSIGPAIQAGADIGLGGPWFANIDLKKAWIRTDLKSGSTKLSTLKVDPWLVGVGIGYRF